VIGRAALAAAVAALVACASEPESPAASPRRSSGAVTFAYGTPSGELLSSASTRGRVTALLFVTTFDLPSQLMAKRLDAVVRVHRPRANAGAVALEAPNEAPLVEVFRSSLALSYPVALANTMRFEADNAFGSIDQVPVLVILDARGHEVARASGVVSERELDDALTRAAH
jgi:plasmid replication initiation protein